LVRSGYYHTVPVRQTRYIFLGLADLSEIPVTTEVDEQERETGRVLGGVGPGYALLFGELSQRIRSGEFKPDEQIPSERELCETYGVSRTLVRQALDLGEREGLLVRVPSKGTFVARPRIIQDLARMTTFQTTLAHLDLTPSRRVLRTNWETPSPEVAQQLRVSQVTPLLYLEVMGLADGSPLALYQSHVPAAIVQASNLEARLGNSDEGSTSSSYEIIASALGATHLDANQLYEVTAIDATSAAALSVAPYSPTFRVTTVFSLPEGTPVEARTALYLGDRYGFRILRPVALQDDSESPDEGPSTTASGLH
jgi:GntR family transcriptional regulator